jgi:DNA-binding XRE family transcriptional regulator/predicted RNA-binding Zn-ribbon protein involved in translation (DUF1610 family)
MATVIKCAYCGSTEESGPDTISEGGLAWQCPGCGNEWEIRTAFFKQRRAYDSDRFSSLVADAMDKQKITQGTVAGMVGVTGAYINHIVHGKRLPTLPVARRILEVLGMHDEADAL